MATTRVIPVGHLDEDQVRSVLHAAMAAPSPHDRESGRFLCTATTIELYTDDPDNRELLLSCGAALVNLRLAIRALGVHPAVQLLPDPHRTNLLAVIRPLGHTVVRSGDRELADAIFRRRTDRGPHTGPIPPAVVAGLRQAAKTERAWLFTLRPAHLSILRGLVHQAQEDQHHDPALVTEPLIAVIGTFHDSPLARLQAGQATQRVLLAATVAGLPASLLSQVLAVPATRKQLRELIVGGLWPQAVLQIGYGAPVPAIARRDLDDVVPSA
jgi:nitroreductase